MTSISSSMSSLSGYACMQSASRPKPGGAKPDFSKIDTDGSGGLDKSELQAMLNQRASDTGSTEAIDSDELFSRLDADADGSITEQELKDGMKPPSRPAGEQGWGAMGMSTSDFAGMAGPGGMPPPPPGGAGGPPPLSSLDSDDDGSITQEEFGSIDSDGDNSISQAEASSFDQQMQALFARFASSQYAAVSQSYPDSGSTTLSVVA